MPKGKRHRTTVKGQRVDLSDRQLKALGAIWRHKDEVDGMFGGRGSQVMAGLTKQGLFTQFKVKWRRTALGGAALKQLIINNKINQKSKGAK